MLFQQGFSDNISNSGSKMNYFGLASTESKSQKASNTKSLNLQQASGSNANSSSNGVYVDLGKALLEAAKAGDAEKVQECIKNGAPFITDWVNCL